MNALVIYALAACEIFPAALQGFYWRSPENNLVLFLPRLVYSSCIHLLIFLIYKFIWVNNHVLVFVCLFAFLLERETSNQCILLWFNLGLYDLV